jgi:GNAT superfamily N-acetyltransferase
MEIRQARADDYEAVAAFTRETWSEREGVGDYIPDIYHEWIEGDGPDQRTFVADAGDDIAGLCQSVVLSEHEAWAQGMRVNPDYRGRGVADALNEAHFDWAREQGATVCRNMVFSWNIMGLGQSRAVGFEPETEFGFAEPEPAPAGSDTTDTDGLDPLADPDPNAAWAFWSDSDARDHLRGLALDPDESWACSALTRERLATAAAEDRLLGVADADGFAGFAVRTRVTEREVDGETVRTATYGAAAWRDADAAGALYDAVAADAAAADADDARVLIPETVEHVSDTGANRVPVAAEPDFVMCADLTGGEP